jgi:hypothetical protein
MSPAAGSSSQRFGNALALDGDRIVAGAPYNDTNAADSGAAFVFRYDAATDAWIEEQELFPSDPESSARFGTSVAIDDDLIVVGAPLKNASSSVLDTGAIYVFRYDSTTGLWSEAQKLVASNAVASDQFGASAAVNAAAGALVAGAPRSNTTAGLDSGSVYVFRYQDPTLKWLEEVQLVDPDGAASDQAGTVVAMDSTTVVVGSPRSNEGGFVDAGCVDVWSFDGANWNHDHELVPSVQAASNQFGSSLGLYGDQLAVGAPLEDASTSIPNSGAAYLFRRNGGAFAEEARLQPPSPLASSQFGWSVAVRDKIAVVGAPFDNVNGLSDAGAAYTFRYSSKKSQWFTDQQLGASDAAAVDDLGYQVALHDSRILATAPLNNTAFSDWGVMYGYDAREIVLTIDPTDPAPDQTITFEAFRGDPGDPVMITVEDVSGTPMFLPIILYSFQANHAFTFTANAPNPALGLHVGLRAYKVSPTGPVVFSDLAYVDV